MHYILIALLLISYILSQGEFPVTSVHEAQGYINNVNDNILNCIRGPYLQIGNPYGIAETFIVTVTDPWGATDVTTFSVRALLLKH